MERVAHTEETDVGLINATGELAAQLATLEESIDRQLEAFSKLQIQRDELLAALRDVLAIASANAEDVEAGLFDPACNAARAAIGKAEGQ